MNIYEYNAKMSRRKQANPKSFKENMNSNEPMDLTAIIIDNQSNDSYNSSLSSNTSCNDNDELNDLQANEQNDDEIDVEKLSDPEDENENEEDKKSIGQEESSTKPIESSVQSAPFMLNGKKYYPLIYHCQDCGLRYSDKNTLITHQQNYCSKRTQEIKKDENSQDTVSNPSSHLASNTIKTLIYQCNNCSFTTDKIFTMNKHSRVHLPQKRKAMEELNKDDSSLNLQAKFNDNLNEQQTYCKECDIKFSSLKTYYHHKTHYCQKYKTIEAIVPCNNDAIKLPMNDKQMPKEPIKYESKPSITCPSLPVPQKQGEVVYVPVYIPTKTTNPLVNMPPRPVLFRPHLPFELPKPPASIVPLDLRLSNSNDTPLDLSVKTRKSIEQSVENDHDDEMLIYCKNCRNSFETVNAFKTHPCKLKQQQQQNHSSSLPGVKIEQSIVSKQTSTSQQQKQYFICSTCGYRGNTVRGVRQHGKLHLSNKEPFGIIDSFGEEVQTNETQQLIKHQPQRRSSQKSDNDNDEQLIDSKRFKSDFYDQSQQQSEQQLNYCNKCKIHFNHEYSFLAHKKFYCTATSLPIVK